MTSAMIGSRPVVGSSKKMISGSAAMARARPTRFCMPPDSSDGKQLGDLGAEADLRQLLDRDLARLLARRPACALEQAEGDVLPDRQAVEQRAALEQHAELAHDRLAVASPRLDDLLAVDAGSSRRPGCSRPRMHFSSTDLPVPEPPITTSDSPARDVEVDAVAAPSSAPKDLCRPRSAIFGVGVASSREEQLGDDVVEAQDQDRGRDHGVGRRRADALRAAAASDSRGSSPSAR